ncbi:hypothetical protein A1O3_04514 [Capronia epimyces CBS 606.96]|uniref:Uncharacterized protein n=1 Tax=Capronia epimyces CBS 606.96 TaxID=1182542 RepID=W9YZ34_9EURO|nr:uncharacterized protein A1O3_04514 [Capronia epimyces CBS 606.96]EXJ87554.1 hypothetical protein A1O3_04514 [Capronia epimyces CBS 606.96]
MAYPTAYPGQAALEFARVLGRKPRRKATHYGAPPLPSASKKRKRNKAASPEEEKFTDRAFPEAPDQADEADQMLYKMGGRLERNWDEIEKKREEMTGEAPGTGTNVNLTARFLWTIKLSCHDKSVFHKHLTELMKGCPKLRVLETILNEQLRRTDFLKRSATAEPSYPYPEYTAES